MNEKQKELYEEWKRLEISTILKTEIGPERIGYIPHITQKRDDILKLEPTRKLVWVELKEFLTPDERINLGMSLDKTLDEIFN